MSKVFCQVKNGSIYGFSKFRDGDDSLVEYREDSSEFIDFIENGSPINTAKSFVRVELLWADTQIKYIEDEDPRASVSADLVRGYRKELRDYIKGGIISPDKPIRPQ